MEIRVLCDKAHQAFMQYADGVFSYTESLEKKIKDIMWNM